MYAPLSLHSHYSLLRGLNNPSAIVKALSNFGITSAALTDYDKVSGAVEFSKQCDEANIKPILGSKIYISDDAGYVTVIAKNKLGWKELTKLSSVSHDVNHITKSGVPQVSFEELACNKNLIIMAGEPETILEKSDNIDPILEKYKSAFGDRFLISIQRMNQDECPYDKTTNYLLTDRAKLYGIECVGVPGTFYINKSDKADLNLLLCNHHKVSWNELPKLVETIPNLARFISGDNCHLPSPLEMSKRYSESELKNSELVADMCEDYTILANPTLPKFECPNGYTEAEYLRQLCREGWKRLTSAGKIDTSRTKEYVERINMELSVFNEAGLEGYFLIVQDYVNWVKKQGVLVGCSRGSAGGSIVSFLTDIITIDPIVYELYFERFYNKGRNSPGKISLPDIDVDFPVAFRERVFEYIRTKYGRENVTQVCTFSSLQGRGAIKEVMRIHRACSNDVMNDISKRLPQKASIEDKLEEAKEKSIIRWTLHNDPDALKDWCTINDDDTLSGSMAPYFEQAMRMEGVYKSYGKHASALCIGSQPIDEICPMVNDKKTGALIAGIEYEYLELTGLPKFDILGLSTLDKLMGVNQLLRTGKLSKIDFEPEESEDEE